MTKRGPGLIITADDFGLHESVNQAVERAHCEGVLSAASLMVAAPAAADAIARARALPSLRVGLHLVLADGQSVLPHAAIPDLVDAKGRFGDRMARDGVRFFFLPWVRRQLAAEGTSFSALLDEERRERALLLLHARSVPLKKIAGSLGYANVANFARAFFRWTGRKPSEHRHSND